jgi:hypothetical protein
MRRSSFDRDFEDLHGRRPAGFIRHEDVRAGRLVSSVSQPGLRLVLGALGLFWTVVTAVVLVAMVAVAVAAVLGFLDPAQLGP